MDTPLGESGLAIEPHLYYNIDGVPYFTPRHQPSHTLPTIEGIDSKLQPIVIVPLHVGSDGFLTRKLLERTINRYLKEDDVLCQSLLQTLALRIEGDKMAPVKLESTAVKWLYTNFGVKRLVIDSSINVKQTSPGQGGDIIHVAEGLPRITGPYLCCTETNGVALYPIYHLYPDTSKAFVVGCYPLEDGTGRYASIKKLDDNGDMLIPVPSKMYASSSKKPLAGLRVGVKDIFDIKGLKTTAGSRVFADLHDKGDHTAESLRVLKEAGVVIVGKVKTSQFLRSGLTIEDTYDDIFPFSPRSDQYQSCGSSSSGSASAIASYDWLDFTVASDTDGSTRHPAAVVGLYGIRPTHGLISTSRVLPALAWADAVGLITRDPKIAEQVLTSWIPNKNDTILTTLLIPTDDFANMREDMKDIFDKFVREMARTLSMSTKFLKMGDVVSSDSNILGEDEIPKAIAAWQWKHFGKSLYETYQATHEGRLPPIGYRAREAFKTAQEQRWGEGDLERAKERFDTAGRWFVNLLKEYGEHEVSCIYVELTAWDWLPTYREQKLNDSRTPLSKRINPLGPYVPASVGGCPHFVIPIGQVPFKSLVSGQTEMQTISVSLVGPPHSDISMLRIMGELEKNGVIRAVKTGREAFSE